AGTPRQSQVRSSAFGNLRRTEPLDLPGVWTVELVGPEMNAQLRITVNPDPTGPPIGAPQAPQSQQEPQQQQGEQQATDAPPIPEQDQQDAAGQGQGPGGAAEQNNGLPQVAAPEPSPQVPAAGLPTASLRDGDVVGVLEAREVWRLSFGPDSGGTSGLLQLDDRVLVGHGNHVLVVDANTGVVAQRFRMPARVANIERSVDTIEVVIVPEGGAAQRLPFSPDEDGPLYSFEPNPDLYGWLRAEAAVPDPEAALAEDPTNSWLYVAAAQLSDQTRAEV